METEVCQVAPSTWARKSIEDVCVRVTSGGTPSRHNREFFHNGTWAWVKSQELQDRWIDDTEEKITDEAIVSSSAKILPPNTVLLALYGATVGQLGILRREMTCNQACCAMIVDPKQADFRYLFYQLIAARPFLKRLATGAAQQNLSGQLIRSLQFPFPPLKEQQAIACILGTLDDKIELNRRMNQTLEAMARAIFKSWFVDFDPVIDNAIKIGNSVPNNLEGKAARRRKVISQTSTKGYLAGLSEHLARLFPNCFIDSELGMIPGEWRVVKMEDIADVIDCLHSKKPERKEVGLPLLQLWNIRDDGLIDMTDTYYISEADYKQWIMRMEASPGDCVITNVGRVGAVAQIPDGLKAALGRNMTGIRCKSAFPFPTFLIECLLSDAMRNEIALKMDTGTILDALNVRNIPKLRLVLPHRDLLRKFEELARPLRARMERNLLESHTLSTLRDVLLPRLISGDLCIPDAERIVGRCI